MKRRETRVLLRGAVALARLAAVFTCASTPSALGAQAPTFNLAAREPSTGAQFSRIASAVALPDGRVVVLDDVESEVALVDQNLLDRTTLVRSGRGPLEAMLPYRLLRSASAGVLVIDRVASRVVEIDSAGRVLGQWREAGTRSCARGSAVSPVSIRFIVPDGRFFSQGPPIAFRANGVPEAVPQIAIQRWRGRCDADTVATIAFPLPPDPVVIGNSVAGRGTSRRAPAPFETSTQWAVDARGRIAIVSPAPYEVSVVQDGREITRHRLVTIPVPVSPEHKRAWLAEQRAARPAIAITRGGAVSSSMQREAIEEPREWPRSLPPFLNSAVSISPQGFLWIKRTTDYGSFSAYDVIDFDRGLVARVQFEPTARVVGFTDASVLLAVVDEDDLQTLVSRTLPRPLTR